MTVCAGQKARATQMAAMYREGLTLAKIGQCYGVTRERVRQILKSEGMTWRDGGANKRMETRRNARDAAKTAQSIRRWGFDTETMDAFRAEGLTVAYVRQRSNARMRGIAWNFDFAAWISVWQTSGKLHLRGRGKGKYVMSRVGDCGAYELGNVHIQLATSNSRDAVKKWRGKRKAHRGVFLLYPGREKAWLATLNRVRIGYFRTEEEAVCAREDYAKTHGINATHRSGRGRGWTYIAKLKSRPYQMQIAGHKTKFFATAEEAHAEYLRIAREDALRTETSQEVPA